MAVDSLLRRIAGILRHHDSDAATWVASVIPLVSSDEDKCYRLLNSKRMWGGAGSVANEALADNPGLDEMEWQAGIREFRELMIALGSDLQSRGNANPDISSWLLAFSNWNQSGV